MRCEETGMQKPFWHVYSLDSQGHGRHVSDGFCGRQANHNTERNAAILMAYQSFLFVVVVGGINELSVFAQEQSFHWVPLFCIADHFFSDLVSLHFCCI
jgi:hypothetical protein